MVIIISTDQTEVLVVSEMFGWSLRRLQGPRIKVEESRCLLKYMLIQAYC